MAAGGAAVKGAAPVLFDAPGPRARRRHRVYGLLALAGALAVGAAVLLRLSEAGQFVGAMWEPFTYRGVQERVLRGVLDTLKAFGLAVVLSLVLGVLLATGRLSSHRWIRWPCAAVVEVFRALPLLILIFALYNMAGLRDAVEGFGNALRNGLGAPGDWLATHYATPTLWALAFGVALYNGAVHAELLRSGARAVGAGQWEAAYALGMRKRQVLSTVVLPQTVRAMLPGIMSQIVVTLKDTSLGFIIMYEELLYAGKLLAQNISTPYGYPYLPVLWVVGSLYVVMCLLLSLLARQIARPRNRREARVRS
ncbi:amino acid ABC transporter permease [Streptomyces iconiensis]|uniref:ABC transporter permease subunit n=1 Tax=Streptomyces iconiensis TaxID=1384038 RepID=A0ABT6ZQT6_9ACTN|nr:ABC transporter permease subunit [Streptomyces iconiensis]MDJ1131419.1 ABC transporter permease subunit [Streptomyces iconiensis]